MQIFLAFGLAMSILVGTLQAGGFFDSNAKKEAVLAAAELQNYRTFTQSVDAYVAANPTYTGTLTWATIKTAATTAQGNQGATMPPSFKAVVNAGAYTVCGQLSPSALAKMMALLPVEQRGSQAAVVASPTTPYQVLGPTGTDFISEATKCS